MTSSHPVNYCASYVGLMAISILNLKRSTRIGVNKLISQLTIGLRTFVVYWNQFNTQFNINYYFYRL